MQKTPSHKHVEIREDTFCILIGRWLGDDWAVVVALEGKRGWVGNDGGGMPGVRVGGG